MEKPIVAIVGRPNVGKSTLFNKLTGKRIAIVEDTPGVTRDRIFGQVEWLDNHFTLIDTGGIEFKKDELIPSQIRKQAEIAIDMAHVIVFVADGKLGLNPHDREIASILRKTKKPIILVLNKVDGCGAKSEHFYDFYEFGFDDPIEISASGALGLGDLLDEIVKNFPKYLDTSYDEDIIKVSIVGKPNAGKSSIINRILGEERVIVSPIAGTTRDAIDTYFEEGDDKFVLIDTAGIRKKSKIYENVEKYSILRAMTAIDRSDVVLIVIDATVGVTEQDTKIAGLAMEAGKCAILVINKWDLIEKDNKTMAEYQKTTREKLPFLPYAPMIFVSALTKQRLKNVLDTVKLVNNNASLKVGTGALNDVIGEAVAMNQPPSDKGKRLKIYYATQVASKPPRFALFVNNPDLRHFSYVRYLENKIRDNFDFTGTPIKLEFRSKKD
ncbi:ribosome biogenesis GTPase Der [Peptostreptococcaceae bacterium AGR-M142]